jgi:hypothetical protein
MRNACKVLARKPEGKRPLAKPRRGWEDNRMDLKEIGEEVLDLMDWVMCRDKW